MHKKTKIVCTIGPASESLETLVQLLQNGMNVARLNFSHGTHEEHGRRIDTIRKGFSADRNSGGNYAGYKRTGNSHRQFRRRFCSAGSRAASGADYRNNHRDCAAVSASANQNIIDDLHIGDSILLDDGLIVWKF